MRLNFSNPNSALALLLAINLFNYIDRYILAAVLPKLEEAFFLPGDPLAFAKLGSLQTAFLLSYMLMAPVFGWLADRRSRWLLIAGAVALWSIASGWSGLATSFTALLITRIFVGIGEAGYGPAAPTIIADLYGIKRRGFVLSLFYLAIPVGSAIGYGFGGKVAEHLDWRWAFWLVVPPGLILAALCLFQRDPRPVRDPAVPRPKVPLGALLRIPSYVWNTAAMTALTFAIGGISFWIPHYIYRERAGDFPGGPNLGNITLIFGAITAVAGLAATLGGGWLADRLRARIPTAYFTMSGIAVCIAFPCSVAMLLTPFPWAWGFLFMSVFFLFCNTGPSNTALANTTPPEIRAMAFAVNIFAIHALGDAISPPLIGWVAGKAGMTSAMLLVSATTLIAGACWFNGARYLVRDTEAVEKAQLR